MSETKSESFKNRRRYPRFKIPKKFKLKARIRLMGEKTSHYFEINNLSMGGASLISHKGVSFPSELGRTVEILIFSGEMSLRCVARIASTSFAQELCVQAGIEIVGIDEKSRKTLGDFLRKLETTHEAISAKITTLS